MNAVAETRLSPSALIPRCQDNPGGTILRALCSHHPSALNRLQLMRNAGISVESEGRLSAYAAFAYWVCRLNDALPSWGWRIDGGLDTNEFYRLVPA